MLIYCEGPSEELYIKGAFEHDVLKQEFKDLEVKNIKAININLIDTHIALDQKEELIIVLMDSDYETATQKALDAKESAKNNNVEIRILFQKPNFEFFICSHFSDFNGLISLDTKKANIEMKAFIRSKSIQYKETNRSNKRVCKVLEYSNIINAGGDYANCSRYPEKNEIIQLLK